VCEGEEQREHRTHTRRHVLEGRADEPSSATSDAFFFRLFCPAEEASEEPLEPIFAEAAAERLISDGRFARGGNATELAALRLRWLSGAVPSAAAAVPAAVPYPGATPLATEASARALSSGV